MDVEVYGESGSLQAEVLRTSATFKLPGVRYAQQEPADPTAPAKKKAPKKELPKWVKRRREYLDRKELPHDC